MNTRIIPLENDLQVKQDQEIVGFDPAPATLPMAEMVDRFISATGKRSEHTARAYMSSVGQFLEWYGNLAKPTKQGRKTVWEIRGDTTALADITLATLDKFSHYLTNKKDSAQSTINNRVAGVMSFLAVALRERVISRDQANALGITEYRQKQRRNQKPVGRRLDPNEVRKLREIVKLQALTDPKAARDAAIFDLMLFAGLRRSEVAGLTLADIKRDGGRWWIVFEGKGRKTRRIKLHDSLYQSLDDWLKHTGRELGNGDNGPIFYNMLKGGGITGNRLNASVIGRLVAEYGAAAGLAPRKGDKRLSPHDLRRTCARNAYENGATIYQVQTMLGHSDPKTTIRYIGALENDSDTAVDYVNYARG